MLHRSLRKLFFRLIETLGSSSKICGCLHGSCTRHCLAEHYTVFEGFIIKPLVAGHRHLFDICNHGRTAEGRQPKLQK